MTPTIEALSALAKGPTLLAATGKWHGLGNRLRAVLGSRALARHEGRLFVYTWPTGDLFGARFNELWEFDTPIVSTVASRILTVKYPYRDNTLSWLNESTRLERLWQIRTAHALLLPEQCTPWESDLRALKPVSEIREQVVRIFDDIPEGRPYVGVMIRSNSNAHEDTLKHSPVQWYLERMRQIREFWPDVHFYVSADTPEAFREVRKEITNCHGQEDKGKYNSKEALVASVVDLYMLAASTHLLAPHFSSFPELSQRLAGPELKLETSLTDSESVLFDPKVNGDFTYTLAPNPLQPHLRMPF